MKKKYNQKWKIFNKKYKPLPKKSLQQKPLPKKKRNSFYLYKNKRLKKGILFKSIFFNKITFPFVINLKLINEYLKKK